MKNVGESRYSTRILTTETCMQSHDNFKPLCSVDCEVDQPLHSEFNFWRGQVKDVSHRYSHSLKSAKYPKANFWLRMLTQPKLK